VTRIRLPASGRFIFAWELAFAIADAFLPFETRENPIGALPQKLIRKRCAGFGCYIRTGGFFTSEERMSVGIADHADDTETLPCCESTRTDGNEAAAAGAPEKGTFRRNFGRCGMVVQNCDRCTNRMVAAGLQRKSALSHGADAYFRRKHLRDSVTSADSV
jgi:hypothetical protein